MNLAKFIEKMQALPPDKQTEVLEFIEFLASRSATKLTPKESLASRLLTIPSVGLDEDFERVEDGEWTDTEFSTMAMNQAMRGIDEETPLYTVDDLKEGWQ